MTNELVFVKNRQALTTSLKVAEVFEKQHLHVMRDIRDLREQIGDISNFGLMFRGASSDGNKRMCAAVHDVIIPMARAAGSTTPDDKFYITYQRAVNKAAGVKPKSRDELPLGQLYEVEKLQSIVEVSIRGLAAAGADSNNQIYRDTNQTLENYSRLSLITQRFLSA